MKFKGGQALVELLLAVALTSLMLPALLTGLVASREGAAQLTQRTEAITYLREMHEAVRSIRDKGWSSFAVNGTYHPVVSGTEWDFAAGTTTVNGFTQSVVITDVSRLNGAIVTSGGAVDPSTKKATLTVSWTQPYSSSIQSEMYLTRFQDNAVHEETLITDFNAAGSVHTGVAVRQTSGGAVGDGEVVLGAGGYGNWCNPNLTSVSYDLSGNGVAQGVWAIEGKAFVGTGDNASGLDFINVSISNPPQPTPPVITEQGVYDQNLKVNDVFGEMANNVYYAYLATNTNSKEVVILNASNNPPTQIAAIDVPGSSSANSIFVQNNLLYVVVGNRLYTYDITNRASPQVRGNRTLNAVGRNVFVVGEYAYVAETDSTRGLEIIRVSNNGQTLTIDAWANVNGEDGRDVFVNQSGTLAYFIASSSSSKPEFFVIDISTKSGSRPTMGSYDTNGMNPKALTVTSGNNVIVVGHGGIEYQVLTVTINASNQAIITQCGFEDTPENLNGVTSVLESDGDAYSYVITQNSSAEFRLIVGGPGGNYASTGVFESATFTPGYQTANNRFTPTFSQPNSTTIRFQVSMADLVGDPPECPDSAGFTFVGPDGRDDSYFTLASGETAGYPYTNFLNYVNPGYCLRYRVYFTTVDSSSTPVFNDITINYSP